MVLKRLRRLLRPVFSSPRPQDGRPSFRPRVERLEGRLAPAAVVTLQNPPAGIFPQITFTDPHPTVGGEFGATVVTLSTGNVVITDPEDDAGGADAGAVYLFNGQTGALISTLTGSTANDQIGAFGVTALSNGNFVVNSPFWHSGGNDVGAATWGSGTTGVGGVVSAANSIIGSTNGDDVGGGVTALSNGNFVIDSSQWQSGANAVGAATWGNGSTGQSATGFGAVSAANSIIGSTNGDFVGSLGPITALSNGNFVVGSPFWHSGGNAVGAATWGNGTTGQDALGNFGAVSAANSIIGSTNGDHVGLGGVTALSNGNFVVDSFDWQSGANDVGAATWGNGTTGQDALGNFGAISAADSLIGSINGDDVGFGAVTALSNGNFVVGSFNWHSGGNQVGAATWGNGTTGQDALGNFGAISAADSLIGSTNGDHVGGGVVPLSNGNFVVESFNWQSGGNVVGAATWGNGLTGQSATGFGAVSAANSIIGSSNGDDVGQGGITALSNGNFVVGSPFWHSGGNDVGAATWGNGLTGQSATGFGAVSAANSLIGSTNGDKVAFSSVTPLSNGNFVVNSPDWQSGANVVGAATWGNGLTGQSATGFGVVSAANSIIGSTNGDDVGSLGATALSNGNFVVNSPDWQISPGNAVGAATWGNGSTGQTLDGSHTIDAQNSILGQSNNSDLSFAVNDSVNQDFVVPFELDNNTGRVVAGFTNPNLLTFARGGTQTITVTPAFVAGSLAGGTAVTVQATTTLNVVNSLLGGNANLNLQSASIVLTSGITVTTGSGTASFSGGTLTLGGATPGSATIAGILGFTSTLTYQVRIDGTTPGVGFDQLIADGGVNLGGAVLSIALGFTPNLGQGFTLISNPSGSAVVGTFAGLPEGRFFTIDGQSFEITYKGGAGHDVVLTRANPPPPPVNVVVPLMAVGADAGGGSQVVVYNATTGALVASFYAFAPSFTGGVRVAVDDVNGDGTNDIICAAGPGTAPQVVVIDGTRLNQVQSNGEIAASAVIASFFAFNPTFSGGVFVAAGTSSSGQNWIAAGAGAGGGPQVVVWTAKAILTGAAAGTAPTPLTSFYAFASGFSGGVTVALGDVTGSGKLDVIAGAGPGGGPQVIVVDGTKFSQIPSSGVLPSGTLLASFEAFSASFSGGVFVAAGGVTGLAEIICGAGPGGGPQIALFSGKDGSVLASFDDPRFGSVTGVSPGIRVGTTTINGQVEILAAPGPGSPPLVDVFNPQTLGLLDEYFAGAPSFFGGLFLAGPTQGAAV